MAVLSDYLSGTITVTNGSTAFTGTGTAWRVAGFREGDTVQLQGFTAIIAGTSAADPLIESNTAGHFTEPWAGASGTYAYRMRYLPDGARVTAQTRALIELLGNGVLYSIAELPVEEGKLLIGNASGQYVLIDRSELGIDDPHTNLSQLAAIAKANDQFIIMGADGTITLKSIKSVTDAISENADAIAENADIIASKVDKDDVRIKILNSVTLHVSTDGNDVSGGLDTPFKTINACLSFIYKHLDLNSFTATVKIADGTYAENIKVNGKPAGSGTNKDTHPISLIGNTSLPNLVKIGLGSGTTLDVKNQAFVSISGLHFIQSDYAISVRGSGSTVAINGEVEFEKQEYDHIASSAFSVIDIFSDYTILGGGMNHLHSTEGGAIFYHGTRSITVKNNPNFWGQFAGCAFAVIQVMNTAFVGAATGRRFLCHFNGEIRTGTDNRQLFPGSISGALMTGGKFDAVPFNSVTKTTNQALVQNVPTLVSWDATVANVNHMMIEFYKLVPSAGYCSISATLSFEGLTAGQSIYAILYKNGQSYKVASKLAQSSYDAISIISPDEPVNDGDYFQIYAQYSGNSGAIRGNPSLTYMSARQI